MIVVLGILLAEEFFSQDADLDFKYFFKGEAGAGLCPTFCGCGLVDLFDGLAFADKFS